MALCTRSPTATVERISLPSVIVQWVTVLLFAARSSSTTPTAPPPLTGLWWTGTNASPAANAPRSAPQGRCGSGGSWTQRTVPWSMKTSRLRLRQKAGARKTGTRTTETATKSTVIRSARRHANALARLMPPFRAFCSSSRTNAIWMLSSSCGRITRSRPSAQAPATAAARRSACGAVLIPPWRSVRP